MRTADLRHYAIVALLVFTTLTGGACSRATPRADTPPRIRVRGARILEADPDLMAVQQAEALPPEKVVVPVEAPGLYASVPPAGVAPGVLVSLDVVDAQATEVLRGLAYQGNVDLVLAGRTDSRVTIRLQERPWAEAFGSVLSAAHLVARWDDQRVRVLTPEQLRVERTAADQLEAMRPETQVVVLHSLPAKEIAKTLVSVLSSAGRIGLDEERNALIVTDTPTHIAALRHAVAQLDRVPLQVVIEAIIVDVTLSDELHYGFDWTVTKAEGDAFDLLQALRVGAGTNPVTNPGGALGFTLLGDRWTIDGVYDVLQTFDSAKILANPRVLAINNRKASIEIIDEIPYQELTETSDGGQIGTTSFKEVGVKLSVTPRIAGDGSVHIELTVEQSSETGAAINAIPVVQTRRGQTTMTVQDGRIAALAGLRRHRQLKNEAKIPVLGDIPGLGALFRRVQMVDVDTELVVFIRPKVMPRNVALTRREQTLSEALDHVDRRPQVERSDFPRLNVEEEDENVRRVP